MLDYGDRDAGHCEDRYRYDQRGPVPGRPVRSFGREHLFSLARHESGDYGPVRALRGGRRRQIATAKKLYHLFSFACRVGAVAGGQRKALATIAEADEIAPQPPCHRGGLRIELRQLGGSGRAMVIEVGLGRSGGRGSAQESEQPDTYPLWGAHCTFTVPLNMSILQAYLFSPAFVNLVLIATGLLSGNGFSIFFEPVSRTTSLMQV